MAERFKARGKRKIPMVFDNQFFDVPVQNRPSRTYTQHDFQNHIGQWIEFKTQWGTHQGVVERVNRNAVLVKMSSDAVNTKLVDGLNSMNYSSQLIGYDGIDGHYPYWKRGPWCWCWFPLVIIVFVFPFFWW